MFLGAYKRTFPPFSFVQVQPNSVLSLSTVIALYFSMKIRILHVKQQQDFL